MVGSHTEWEQYYTIAEQEEYDVELYCNIEGANGENDKYELYYEETYEEKLINSALESLHHQPEWTHGKSVISLA